MKILLDECLPVDFRHSFPDHEVHSVQWAGFKGKKNGELLAAAEAAAYQVFLTIDHGIPHQERPADRNLAIILMRAKTNQLEDLVPLIDSVSVALTHLDPGQVISIPAKR